jgi:putative PEP-CTERM system TPR-repeat lipoprotein
MPINSRAFKRTLIASSLALVLVGCGQKSAEEAYADAQHLVTEQQYDAAIVELKHAIQQAPRDPNPRFLLGKIYLEQQQFAFAEKELEKAKEFGYAAADVIPLLSQAYQRNGTFAGIQRLDASGADLTDQQRVQVGFYQLQSALELGKLEDAQTLLDSLTPISIDNVYRRLIDVLGLLLEADRPAAISKLEQVLDKYPESIDGLNMLAALYLQDGQKVAAAPVLARYLEVVETDLEAEFTYTQLLFETDQAHLAQPHLDKLLKVAPKNPRLHQLQAMVHASNQQFADARESAQTALTLGYDSTIVRFVAGYSAFMQRDFTYANEQLSLIANELPESHPGLKMLAASQLATGQSLQANDILAKYTEMDTQDAALLAQTGYALFRDGHREQASQMLEQIQATASAPEDLAKLGVLKLQMADLTGLADIETAVERNPESTVARETLAKAYIATKKFDEAAQLAKQWQASEPDNYKAYLLAGEAALKLGNLSEGQAHFAKANQLAPNVAQTHLALVNIHMAIKDYSSAFKQVQATLDAFPNNVNAIAVYYALVKLQRLPQDAFAPFARYLEEGTPTAVDKVLAAQLLLNDKRADEAQTLLESLDIAQLGHNVPRAYWQVYANTLFKNGSITALEAHYAQWHEQLPNDLRGFVGRLSMFELKREFAQGLAFIERNPKLSRETPVKILHALFAAQTKDAKLARRLFDSLPENIQNEAQLQSLRARILLLEGNQIDALRAAETGYNARVNRDSFLVYYDALRLNNRAADATALLKQYEAAQPADATAKLLAAQHYLTTEPEAAITRYKDVLAIHPEHFVALNNLAYLLAEQGQYQDALQYAERAHDIAPKNLAVVDTLAQIYVALKAPDMALNYYNEAMTDDVQNEEILLNYVETLLLNQQTRRAQRTIAAHAFEEQVAQDRLRVLKARYNL